MQLPSADFLWGVSITTFGALATVAWSQYQNRLREVRWSVQFQRFASTLQDATFGNVEVLYNKKLVKNLYVGTFEVQNESASDLR